MQELGAALVLAAALGYLAWRAVKRRGNNCCGEKECPAAKQMVERLLAQDGAKLDDTRRGHPR
jgi:hypothetical protein